MMNNKEHKILIVEDEPRLATLLEDYLHQSGYSTECIDNGLQVIPSVRQQAPSLILLDIMLPGKDGLSICREIRSFSDVPIIIMTAKIEEIDRLLGLELGADDYICKPYSPREVVARVKSVLRRSNGSKNISLKNIEIDDDRYKIFIQGKELDLTAVEFQLFKILASLPGRIFSREQLMNKIYRDYRIVNDRTIDSHIKKLRKKIVHVSPDQKLIHSVYGVGYKFEQKE